LKEDKLETKDKNNIFTHRDPSNGLKDYIECFWEHKNNAAENKSFTIFPDSFFKIIFEWQEGQLKAYYLTGIWTKEVVISIPANTILIGIKFKLLAPEFIFKREISSIIESNDNLIPAFWNMQDYHFTNMGDLANHIESIIQDIINDNKQVPPKKLQLSQLLYLIEGNISVKEVSNQINWSTRQISRYLNTYLGVSLKTYLNIQRCYSAYIQIREGRFFPDDGYYDQAHFIRELKKYTGNTPKELHKNRNGQFVQLNNIQKK
jgi:AraC-like DNA-binding protein